MAKKGKQSRRFNTYFRQTAKAFRAARQTQVFSHIKRNLPYGILRLTKDKFIKGIEAISLKGRAKKEKISRKKLPKKYAKKSV